MTVAGRSGSLRAGSLLFGAGQVLALALGLVGTAVLVRVADSRTVASYLLLLQTAAGLSLILALGLGPATLRFAPLSRGAGGAPELAILRRRLIALLILSWLAALPLFAVVWPRFALWLDAPELTPAGPLLFSLAAIISFQQLADAYLRAFRRYLTSVVLKDLLARLLVPGGLLALFALHGSLREWLLPAGVFFAAQVVTALGYAFALNTTSQVEESEARRALPAAGFSTVGGTVLVMGLRGIAGAVLASSDLLVLAAFRPHEEVAIYGVVSRLIHVVGVGPIVAGFLVPQELAVLHSDGRHQDLERLVRGAATTVTLVATGAGAVLLLFGRPLLRVAFGEMYVAGWGLLLLLTVGRLGDAFSGAAGFLLQMTGHHLRLFLITLVAAAVNLGLGLWWTPHVGMYGVAAAYTIAIALFNLATVHSCRTLLGARTFAYLDVAAWRRAARTVAGRVAWRGR